MNISASKIYESIDMIYKTHLFPKLTTDGFSIQTLLGDHGKIFKKIINLIHRPLQLYISKPYGAKNFSYQPWELYWYFPEISRIKIKVYVKETFGIHSSKMQRICDLFIDMDPMYVDVNDHNYLYINDYKFLQVIWKRLNSDFNRNITFLEYAAMILFYTSDEYINIEKYNTLTHLKCELL